MVAQNDSGSEDALVQLRDLLRNGLAVSKYNATGLARNTGMARTTVSNALNASVRPPSEHTVALLAKALGLNAERLLALQRAAAAAHRSLPVGDGRVHGVPGKGWHLTEAEEEPSYEGPREAAASAGHFLDLLDRSCRERNALSGLLERLLRRTAEMGEFDARVMGSFRRRLVEVGLEPALLISAMPQHEATLSRWLRWEAIEDDAFDEVLWAGTERVAPDEREARDGEHRRAPHAALRDVLTTFTAALAEALTSDRDLDNLLGAGGVSLVDALTGRGALAPGFLTGLDHRSRRTSVMRPGPIPRERYESAIAADLGSDVAEREHRRSLQATAAWVYRLPDRDEPIKGRDELVAEVAGKIAEQMRAHGSATAFLSGQPGVGTSAVAVEAARLLARDFRDVVYIDLHGLNPDRCVDAHAAARLIGEALRLDLRVPGGAQDEVFAALGERLAGRRALLVLDGAADAAHVSPLAHARTGCAVIVTSRDRVQGYATPGLAFHVETLSTPDAVEVLDYYAAGRSRQPDLLERVALLCDRLPLALRLAGEQIAALSGRDLELFATRLQDELTRLEYLQVGERALRAVIALSYDRLDPAARRACRLITALPAATTSAQEFGHCVDSPPALAELALSRLVDRSLAHETAQVDSDGAAFASFYLYEMVRLFAQDRLRDEETGDSLADVQRRCVAFLTERLQQIVERAQGADLAAELNPTRFHAAERMAEEHGWNDLAGQIAERLYALYTSRRDVHAMALAHELRLNLLMLANRHDAAIQLCLEHAGRLRELKSTAGALDTARRALRIAQNSRLLARAAEVHLLISVLCADDRDWASALDAGENSARILRRLRLPEAEVKVLVNNARCAVEGGFAEKALDWARRATDLADTLGDAAQRRTAHIDLGRAHHIAGDYTTAITVARSATTLCATDRCWVDAAVAASNGALAASAHADVAAEIDLRCLSTDHWERASIDASANRPYFVQALIDLSAAEARTGSFKPAAATLRRAAKAMAEDEPAIAPELRSEVLVRRTTADRLAGSTDQMVTQRLLLDLASPSWNRRARRLNPQLSAIRQVLIGDRGENRSDTARDQLREFLGLNTLHPPQLWGLWMYEDLGELADRSYDDLEFPPDDPRYELG